MKSYYVLLPSAEFPCRRQSFFAVLKARNRQLPEPDPEDLKSCQM